ncbi:FecR family protein [Subsaximicrobium wynnwilliamsii]|uniref:FecR family protein n=1 Tax=Subsaximicrobium wynnwilliamsii TaxID=291179 RepID=A0A5C6ZD71_9FLAO|nr:FecR family protein [Subsaximicrobium wynnwilliamsii]TXD81181.1 FecR family protein [Subsaximicrobium wynnwilliamsii]TXD86998.1 FecR family protein [Subsaximicrobium wynnwilliamsii]TXE00651.1 FecR family protein [Subsaximicrobium wynnwilliamsii]
MTLLDKIYQLTKKLSKALLDNKGFGDLDESDLFSDDAKKHIKQHLSEEEIKENLELLNKIDKELGWEHVENRISHYGKVKSNKRLSKSSFYKIAAVAVLFISIGYIAYNGLTNETLLEVEQVNFPAGKNKAILTLEDGVDVALEKERPFKKGAVHSNGERLKYSKTSTNSKIAFNYLTIPRGGQYQIELSDGTIVWLNADSKLKYPVAFKSGTTRTVELLYGEAYFDVSPSTSHNGDTFKVLTKDQEVEVLGTKFNIKAYNDERYIYTTLVEGQVNILVNGLLTRLSPSEQTALNIDTQQLTKSIVNVDYHIAWINGYFNFKDTSLKEIMQVISRWYDVDITFESQALEDVRFSGLLSKTQNIEDILNGIQSTKFINAYGIENKTIIIK